MEVHETKDKAAIRIIKMYGALLWSIFNYGIMLSGWSNIFSGPGMDRKGRPRKTPVAGLPVC